MSFEDNLQALKEGLRLVDEFMETNKKLAKKNLNVCRDIVRELQEEHSSKQENLIQLEKHRKENLKLIKE